MVRQFFKKKSKRLNTRKRAKIEKKVREHNRKIKKESKVNPKKGKKKDPGVPNKFPFKEEILKEAEDRKRRLEDERQKQKERRKKEREKLRDKKRNLESLTKDAEKRSKEFERKNAFVEEASKNFNSGKAVETSLKAYYKEFRKVIDAADVVLEVLDARDPLGSRCPQVEEAVLSAGTKKKLVLVLNKIDLVPRDNVEAWLKHLRNEFPTVAFKASTQTQRENLSHSKVPVAQATHDLAQTSRCLGGDTLLKLLGNYCRSQDIRTSISVGVVGFPNTGKSSLINSLKRTKVCGVGATPGFTKAMQAVQLDKHVKLLDSPGVVMATGMSDSAMILRNCVKIETLDDPVSPVEAILKRCNKENIMVSYGIPDYSDVHEFLGYLATRQGRLKKGGVPDANKAAKTVLQDWNSGKIRYYTHPPEQHTLSAHLDAQVVTEMSKEFDIDALLSDETETLKDLKAASSSDMVITTDGPTAGLTAPPSDQEDDDEMVEESDEESADEEEMTVDEGDQASELAETTVTLKSAGRKQKLAVLAKKVPKGLSASGEVNNRQANRGMKMAYKKMKKQRKKSDKVAGQLSDALTGAFSTLGGSGADNYNFDVDFS